MSSLFAKRHYEAIAAIVRQLDADFTAIEPHTAGRYLADLFAADNPRFNRERFLKACGLDS